MKNDAMRRRAGGVKLSSIIFCVTVLMAWLPTRGRAQVNSGSNGSDGAFNPTSYTNIDMASRPSGIYQYTSVNIPNGVTVTFTPNANNTPVVWLVQGNVVISGIVDIAGQSASGGVGGRGGPGGWAGGSAANPPNPPSSGQGPGGGGVWTSAPGGEASYGTEGFGSSSGAVYGNSFLVPLLGGSGGGASTTGVAGQGGGGAILIASSGTIQVDGQIYATGGKPPGTGWGTPGYGIGSGGGVRLVAAIFAGRGIINVAPYNGASWDGACGRVRIDALQNAFGGTIWACLPASYGFQPIIMPTAGQGVQLTVTSVGGVPVSASPTGQLVTPDAVLSAQQNNPIPIIVHCSNLPLNTQVTVSLKPANGATVSATGRNNTGTLASSTATVMLNIPRGGGFIYATAATGN
jgi:hypothetical protein